MPGRSGVWTIDSEEFDALLADFFDWVDRNRSRDVERFLAEREKLADPDKLVESLRNYLDQTHCVEELAAWTTAGWLEARRAGGTILEGSRPGAGQERLPLPAEFGDYELLEELGRGGMGLVYKARQTRLNRIVCVKMILEGRLADEKHVQRFLSEAKAMARLRHPNLVAIYDVGRHQDQYYFSMEYVAGRSLAERIREGPWNVQEAARCVQAVAWAIDYVHANHVLHRDLKPSNILVDEHGQPRVTDFGLARQLDEGSLTASGVLLGTPSYMAPEQTRAATERLDVRCDVYGLGAILYELLAGRPPFRGETPLDTLLAVRTAEPVAPSLFDVRIPRDLETISLKCLEKDPLRRYATARALAEDLGRYLGGEPIQARPISTARRAVRWCRRNPLRFALAATVFLALLSVAGVATTAWFTTAAALTEVEESRDEQRRIARELRRERNSAESHLHLSRTHRVWQAIENGSLAEAEQLLELQIPPAGMADRRGWEWGYLHSLLRQFELSLDGHSTVHGIAWSPCGRRLASIDAGGMLRLWDAAASRELWAIDHPDTPLGVAFSPVGDRLATSSIGGIIRIFDAATGALVDELRDGGTVSRALAWSQNAARIAVAADDGVIIWDVAERAVRRRLEGHSERVNHVSWRPGDNWIASAADDGTVRIWNADADGGQVLQGPGGWVSATAWSANGSRLAAVTQNGELRVWDVVDLADGRLLMAEAFTRLAGQGEMLAGVDWSADGRQLVTGGSSKMLTIWDADGKPFARLRGHDQAVSGLAWRGDGGRIASASADGTIKIWKVATRPPGAPLAQEASPVRCAAWSPNGRWIAWRDIDGITTVWDARANRSRLSIEETATGATGLAWHPKRPRLALARNESVVVFTVPGSQEVLRLDGHTGPVWTIAWDPAARVLASGDGDGVVRIWDAASGRQRRALGGHARGVRCMAWSQDGTWLATADGEAWLRIWKAEAGRLQRRIQVATTALNSLAYSPCGRWLAAATQEGDVLLWNARTGERCPPLRGHQSAVWSVTWGQDGRRLFSGGQDGSIRIWDPAAGQEVLQLAAHDGAVWSVALSPDGLALVSTSVDQTVRQWQSRPRGARRSR